MDLPRSTHQLSMSWSQEILATLRVVLVLNKLPVNLKVNSEIMVADESMASQVYPKRGLRSQTPCEGCIYAVACPKSIANE